MTTWQLRTLRTAVFAALCVTLAAAAHLSMSQADLPAPVLLAALGATAGCTWVLAGRRRSLAVISLWMVAAQGVLHLLFERATPSGGAVAAPAGAAPDWVHLLLCTPTGANTTGMSPVELARTAGIDPDSVSLAALPLPGHRMVSTAGHHGLTAVQNLGAPGSTSGAGDMNGMGGMGGMESLPGVPAMAGHALSPGMLLAHLVAALACAVLLRRGEDAIAGLSALLRTLADVVLPLLLLLLVPRGHRLPAPARPRARHTRLPRLVVLCHALVRRGPPAYALAL
ncbi:hypothetical protein [Kitasatospora sp. NPDC050543]|uniref:hypothetical protein n=1 Tax=Kitasatospora sp. NPDC050543 TaxID=3364054 RepID=UPI00378C7EF5